jgi:hypothetical protein
MDRLSAKAFCVPFWYKTGASVVRKFQLPDNNYLKTVKNVDFVKESAFFG